MTILHCLTKSRITSWMILTLTLGYIKHSTGYHAVRFFQYFGITEDHSWSIRRFQQELQQRLTST